MHLCLDRDCLAFVLLCLGALTIVHAGTTGSLLEFAAGTLLSYGPGAILNDLFRHAHHGKVMFWISHGEGCPLMAKMAIGAVVAVIAIALVETEMAQRASPLDARKSNC